MQDITLFMLRTCPYCKKAFAWMEELYAENPAYKTIPLKQIDESEESALAEQYDYYYVPTYYVAGKKMHEGAASKAIIKQIFDAAMAD